MIKSSREVYFQRKSREEELEHHIVEAKGETQRLGLRLWRLHTAGNAGGVVATLSFMGTAFSRDGRVDEAFFWLLCMFLSGLFCAAAHVSSDIYCRLNETTFLNLAYMVEVEGHESRDIEASEKAYKRMRAMRKSAAIASGASGTILVVATVYALVLLHGLTG